MRGPETEGMSRVRSEAWRRRVRPRRGGRRDLIAAVVRGLVCSRSLCEDGMPALSEMIPVSHTGASLNSSIACRLHATSTPSLIVVCEFTHFGAAISHSAAENRFLHEK
eukprot:5169057-Prymnesium_polylepis.3